MLLELPQIWFSFKPEGKTFRKFAEVFSEKKSLSQWDIFWEFLRNTNVIFMERFGNIHWYNLVPAPCYVTLTTACIRVVMSGDALKRRMMKGGKVVEEKREKNFFVRNKPFPQPPFHSSHSPLTPKISSSSLQLCAWLLSLWKGMRLRVTLLWYKPCSFSDANYFVIMLTRY